MEARAAQTGQNISNSMFYMWRCVIAVAHAHADGKVTDKERAYLNNVFANMDRAYSLTGEQKKTFADDIENPKNVADLLKYINDSSVRGQLIYFCGLLAHVSGTTDPMEEAIIKKLHDDQMSSLDMTAIRKQVNEVVASEMFKHDLAMNEIRPQTHKMFEKDEGGTTRFRGLSLFSALDSFMTRLGFDITNNYVG